MKTVFLATLILLSSVISQAEVIKSSQEKISPATIASVVSLIPGQNDKKLQAVVIDRGMSTDVSPRYTVYLGFAAYAEMGNITADFKITDQAVEFLGAIRVSAGHYVLKTREYTDNGMFEVAYEIDATRIFADEKKERSRCADAFCDLTLNTSVTVKRTVKESH